MAIYWVRTFAGSRKLRAEASGQRNYTRIYKVLADREDKESAIAEELPQIGTGIEGDPFAWASSWNYESQEVAGHKTLWTVTIEFKRPDPGQGLTHEPGVYENPLDVPPTVEIEFADRQRYVYKDLDNKPIANTAGDLFGAEAFVDETDQILIVVRNEGGFSTAFGRQYNNSVNDAPYGGAAKDTLWLKIGPCRMLWHQACGVYWEVAYRLHYNPEGWQLELRNRGFYAKYGSDRRQVVDDRQQPMSVEADLKLDGTQAGPNDAPVYLNFRTKQRRDFTLLGFPIT